MAVTLSAKRSTLRIALAAACGLAMAACTTVEPSDPAADEALLVREAETALRNFMTDSDFSAARRMLPEAVAVIVLPNVVKGGFIFGAEGGSGVAMARGGGGWSDPSFVSVAAGSVGFQIGAQVQDVLMIVRNRAALDALLRDGIKLGAEASVAVGPVGGGVEGNTTTNLQADVVVFADARGAFAGVALEGARLNPRADRNQDYYGQPTAPRTPLMRTGTDARSTGLRALLSR